MKNLLIIILLFLGIQEEKYDISLKLEVGKIYYQTIRTESDFLMMMNDEEMLISTVFEASLSFEVMAATDSNYKLQVQYTKLSMINKSPFATMEFSSEKEDSTNMMSGFLKEMVQKPFTASLNKNGKITEILNIDTLYSTIWDGKAGAMISSNDKLTETLNDQVGAGVIMENYALLSAFYPGRQVAIGESWSNPTELGKRLAGGTMNSFSLSGISDEYITIEGVSETYTKDENATMEVMGKKMQYDLDGGMVFNCAMDIKTGWIEEATIKQDFKGEITLVAEEAWNNRSIPLAITNVITIANK